MLKHAETFHANKGCDMAIVFFIPISLFSKYKFSVQFSNIICTKTKPSTPQLFIWKWITSTLSFILLEKDGNVLGPWGQVFWRGPFFRGLVFLSGPGSASRCGFDTMHKTIRALKTGWTHYNDGCFQAFQTGIPMVYLSAKTGSHPMLGKKNYLSKGKWEGTSLLNQTWGKETDSWWKVRIWKRADKIGGELIFIILMFSLISRSSYSSSNVGNSSLWSVSVSLLPTKTRWNFEISVTSLCPNTSSIQYMSKIQASLLSVFLFGSLVGFFLISILFLDCNKFFINPTLFTLSFIPFILHYIELIESCRCFLSTYWKMCQFA